MLLIFRTFTIWVLTAMVNAVISASCLSLGESEFSNWGLAFILAFTFTLIFSVPAVFIFFITFVLAKKNDGDYLFRLLLGTGFFVALASAIIFRVAFYSMFKESTIFLALSIVVATITAIMLHHPFIVALGKSRPLLYSLKDDLLIKKSSTSA